MPTLPLKTYQASALQSLESFLLAARRTGSLVAAWAQEQQRQGGGADDGNDGARAATPYRGQPLGETPCVCLRIPTGGGKTLLAAHALPLMARAWRQADFPVALWLVPSTTIRDQTLLAPQRPGQPLPRRAGSRVWPGAGGSSGWNCARHATRRSCHWTPCPATPAKPTSCCG